MIVDDPLNIISSTAWVVRNSNSVKIDNRQIDNFCKLISQKIKNGEIMSQSQLGQNSLSAQRIFIQDVVNFCFWAEKDKQKWMIEYPTGNIISGGWYSLVGVFDRAIENKIPILNAKFLEKLSLMEAREIFKSTTQTQIPLLTDRVKYLNKIGKILSENFDGDIQNFLAQISHDALELATALIKTFPVFDDFAIYKKHKINFYKRAQIFIYDLSSLENFKITNLKHLTIFADYKLPQILRHFGIINYSSALANKVDNLKPIAKNSEEEIEIRSATIQSGQIISQQLNIKPVLLDNIIWLMSQTQTKDIKPYHRTLTSNY